MSVINFPGNQPPKDEDSDLIWVCRCGCQSFNLYSNGQTECCNCKQMSTGADSAEWMKLKPEVTGEEKEAPETLTNVIQVQHSNAALQQVVGGLDDQNCSFVVVSRANGIVSTWKAQEFDKHDCSVWWLDDQLAVARKSLLPVGTEPNSLDLMRSNITNSEELAHVVVIRQDGDVSTWTSAKSPIETDDQVAWLDRKLTLTRKLLIEIGDTTPTLDLFNSVVVPDADH